MPRRGRSVPRLPFRVAMLALLRLSREPVAACANYRVIPDTGDRYACRSDTLFFTTDAIPAFGWPTGPFLSQTCCTRLYAGPYSTFSGSDGAKIPLNPFPHPHRRACQHARYVNAHGRPPRCCGPPGDCRCACRPSWRHRDGEHQGSDPLRRDRTGNRPFTPELLKFYRSH